MIDSGSTQDVVGVTASPRVEVVLGDISLTDCDVAVSSVCPSLAGGGRVDAALRRRGGTSLQRQVDRVRAERFPGGLPVGGCVATGGGLLASTWVVHAAGPVFDGSVRVRSELAATYYNALHVAGDLGAGRVALPALCAGGCRFPADEIAAIAVHAAASTDAPLRLVRFVLSDRLVYTAFLRALSARVDNG
jgi:O-acetyl-ADP-ribose deacetylase (regulator of RNase III)